MQKQLDVTGYLSFSNNRFIRALEEARSLLIFQWRIRADERHAIVHEVEPEDVQYRIFPHWDMRFVTKEDPPTIRLEDSIETNLLNIRNDVFNKTRFMGIIWRQLENALNNTRKQESIEPVYLPLHDKIPKRK